MRNFLKLGLLVVCTALAVVFAACGDDDRDSSGSERCDVGRGGARDQRGGGDAAPRRPRAPPRRPRPRRSRRPRRRRPPPPRSRRPRRAARPSPCRATAASSPFAPPKEDANGVLDTLALPENLQAAYNNYGPPLFDTYKDFKPKNGPPWKVGYSDSFSGNAWRAAALASLQQNFAAAKEQGLVEGDLVVTDSNGANDVQIQQMRQMIQDGVDIIFSIPASPTAMNGVIEEAYKAGIPVLTLSAPVTSAVRDQRRHEPARLRRPRRRRASSCCSRARATSSPSRASPARRARRASRRAAS